MACSGDRWDRLIRNQVAEPVWSAPLTSIGLAVIALSSVWVGGRCVNMSGVSEELLETQACSGCCVAHYCSSTCQKQHWKAHKESCRALQSASEPVSRVGRPCLWATFIPHSPQIFQMLTRHLWSDRVRASETRKAAKELNAIGLTSIRLGLPSGAVAPARVSVPASS